jgi:hypothetical protein
MSSPELPKKQEFSLADWAAKDVTESDKYTKVSKSGKFTFQPEKKGKTTVEKVFKNVSEQLAKEKDLNSAQLQSIYKKCEMMLDSAKEKKWWNVIGLRFAKKEFKNVEEAISHSLTRTVLSEYSQRTEVSSSTLKQGLAGNIKKGEFILLNKHIQVQQDANGKISGTITLITPPSDRPLEEGESELQRKEVKLSQKDAEAIFYKIFPSQRKEIELSPIPERSPIKPELQKEIVIIETLTHLSQLISQKLSSFSILKTKAIQLAREKETGRLDLTLPGTSTKISVFKDTSGKTQCTLKIGIKKPITVDEQNTIKIISLISPTVEEIPGKVFEKLKELGEKIKERVKNQIKPMIIQIQTDDGRNWAICQTGETQGKKFNPKEPYYEIIQLDENSQKSLEALGTKSEEYFRYGLAQSRTIHDLFYPKAKKLL